MPLSGLPPSSSWIQTGRSTIVSSGFCLLRILLPRSSWARARLISILISFEQAIQCFQEILVRFPKADAAPEAQYYLGVSKYKASHDPKELKLGLEVLQRDYPSSEWAKKAQVYSLIPLNCIMGWGLCGFLVECIFRVEIQKVKAVVMAGSSQANF